MKRKWNLLLALLLVGLMVFVFAGCTTPDEEPEEDENDVEDVEDVEENEVDALDPKEVLMEAALDYFDHVAAGNNNMTQSAEIKDMLDANPDSVLIIDVRRGEDFEEGHIPGSVHSAPGKIGEIIERIPRNKPVFIACYTGQNAGYVMASLRMAGFDNVTTMIYGINLGWTGRDEFPLEGEGMVLAADLPEVSSPKNEKEEILWERVKEYMAEVDAGQVGWIGVGEPQEAFYEELQSNPNSALVLDIRRADDFAEGHIEHSENVAWGAFGEKLNELPTNIPIAVACYSGQTGAQTMAVLRMLGYDNARNILYGVRDGWVERSELPVVTE